MPSPPKATDGQPNQPPRPRDYQAPMCVGSGIACAAAAEFVFWATRKMRLPSWPMMKSGCELTRLCVLCSVSFIVLHGESSKLENLVVDQAHVKSAHGHACLHSDATQMARYLITHACEKSKHCATVHPPIACHYVSRKCSHASPKSLLNAIE